MKSTIEVVTAIGNCLIIQLSLNKPFDTDLVLATTAKLDKVYFEEDKEWISITVSKHVANLVDAYNYLIYGKARKV